jgi:dihydroflavonol-4-reductase
MKTVVTGASGHVGGNLVRELLAQGHEVRALYRSDTRPLEGLPLEKRAVDVLDREGLEKAFQGAEVVFHLAGRIVINGDPGGEAMRTNEEGTRNVAEAALAAGVRRLVHFSSIHALQHNPWDQPLDETRPLADEAPGVCLTYDRTKAHGERQVRAAIAKGLDAVIVNPTAIIGPIDYKPSAVGAVALLVARRRLPALVDAGFDWVDVRDVSKGAIAAATQGRKGERYMLSGQWRTFTDLAALITREAGVKLPAFTSPMWLAKVGVPFGLLWAAATQTRPLWTFESLTTLKTSHRQIRHDKAERELGYTVRPLEETCRDIVAWFRGAGMLPKA